MANLTYKQYLRMLEALILATRYTGDKQYEEIAENLLSQREKQEKSLNKEQIQENEERVKRLRL